jgi:hypothetical protein
MSQARHPRGWIADGIRVNDTDREQWIDNDEGLYDWWRSSQLDKRTFIRANRTGIDAVIAAVLTGEAPAHYLKYGK